MSPEQQGRDRSEERQQASVHQGVEPQPSLGDHSLSSVQAERLDLLTARARFAEGDILERRQAFSFLVSDTAVSREEQMDVLLSAFEGQDPELKAEAFSKLQGWYFPGHDAAVVSRLSEHLYQDGELDVRTHQLMCRAAGFRNLPEDFPELTAPSNEAILQALDHGDRGSRQEAIHFVHTIEDEKVRESVLIAAIADSDPYIVEKAYSGLYNRELSRTPEHEATLVRAYEQGGPGADRAVYLLHAMDPVSDAGTKIVLDKYFQVDDVDKFEQRLLHYPSDLSRYPEVHERAKPILEAVHRDSNKSFPEKQAALEGLAHIGNPGLLACSKIVLGSVFSNDIWKSRMKEAIRAMPYDSTKRQIMNVASQSLDLGVKAVKAPFQLAGKLLGYLPEPQPLDNETRGKLRTASMSLTLGPLGLSLGLMMEDQDRKAGKY